MILKLLYRWYPESFHKLVFQSQSKPDSFDKLEFVFVDSNGKRYYRFMSDMEAPIPRYKAFEMKFKEFSAGVSRDTLTLIIDTMDAALKETDKKTGNMKPNIAMIGHLITELRNRKDNLIDPEIMMEMVAYLYVREDENPALIDEDIHAQKVKQFFKDSQSGLYDFFVKAGLNRYMPFLEQSGADWETIFSSMKAKVIALREQLTAYSTEKK
jgi:uncharacterized membrane protein